MTTLIICGDHKRLKGRPNARWKDDVENDIRKIGIVSKSKVWEHLWNFIRDWSRLTWTLVQRTQRACQRPTCIGTKSLEPSCYSILFYSILFYSILFYSILFYSVLFYSILFYSVLFCSVLFCSVLFYSILFYSILFYSILFYSGNCC